MPSCRAKSGRFTKCRSGSRPAGLGAAHARGKDQVVVVFRQDKEGGEILAVFPEIEEGRGMVQSYAHVGQHGAASRAYVRDNTRPAPEGPALDALRRELRAIGYDFVERQRMSRR